MRRRGHSGRILSLDGWDVNLSEEVVVKKIGAHRDPITSHGTIPCV